MSSSKAGLYRWRRLGLALWVGIFAASAALPVYAAGNRNDIVDLKALQRAFTDLADQVRPHVVAIRCYETRKARSNQVKVPISQGSGFIFESDGFIATNNHVIEGSDAISIILANGLRYDAKLVQTDPRSDLAVLKIDETGLPAVTFDLDKKILVNQWAFACGNPFGLAFDNDGVPTITYGVVSALDRDMTQRLSGDSELHYYGNLIETSATINPGSSGGPLFDIDGNVIGVVTAIETTSGVSEGHGYAIPITRNTLRVLNTLKTGKHVEYGFLGVRVKNVDPPVSRRVAKMTDALGAKIERVTIQDGPAARAGLRSGDIVIEFDGTPVRDSDHLVRLVQFTPVGHTVPLKFLRQSVKHATTVTLGNREELLQVAIQAEQH